MRKINHEEFEEQVILEGNPCLVIFSRKTCHVCQNVKVILEELEEEINGNFKFYHVDVEEEKALFQKYGLKGVPQVLFFKNGQYVDKLAGQKEENDYKEKIFNLQ